MLMTDSPLTYSNGMLDQAGHYDEMNRLLSAAVVSKSFRNLLLADPEIAVTSGYQGETFNLSDEDRSWLFSVHPTSLVDLAAKMVAYQQNVRLDTPAKMPAIPAAQYARIN